MNEKETYGIELELITNKFKQKINETIGTFKRLKEQMEQSKQFKFQPIVEGDDLKTQIDKIQSSIGAIFKQRKIPISFDAEGGLKSSAVGLKLYNQLSDEAKAHIEDVIHTEQDMIQALNSGNQELIESFTISKRGAEEINTDLRGINAYVNELPNYFGKVGGAISSISAKIGGLSKIFEKVKKTSFSFGDGIKKSFNDGIASIKRFAVALLGVRGIYGLLTKAVRSYLSDHEAVANQMSAMISGLGNLLAPAIEYVIGLVSKLLSYVNAFIKMLTGVDLFAKGMQNVQKSAKGTAKAVNDIKGGLAGIDEITNIASDTDSGGGGGPSGDVSLLPDVDMKPLEKLKTFLSKIFDPFKKAWENTKKSFISSFHNMIDGITGAFTSIGESIFEVFTNGTGQQTIEYIISLFGSLMDIIGNVGEALRLAWENNGNGTALIQSIANIFNAILRVVNSIGESLKKWTASEGFQNTMSFIIQLLTEIFGWIEDICVWIADMYDAYFRPVIEEALLPAIDEIVKAIKGVWDTVKPVVDKIVEILKKVLEPVIAWFTSNLKTAINGVSQLFTNIVNGFKEKIANIKQVLNGVITFVKGVFTGNWKQAWEGIKSIFTGIWDSLVSFIKTPINAVLVAVFWFINTMIDAFNGFKRMLNKISFDIPDWVPIIGGRTFGFNFGMTEHLKTPQLAVGTNYVEREGLAYLHQGEAVVPEKFNDKKFFGSDDETKDLLRELIETIEDKDTNIILDGKKVGQSTVSYINDQKRKLGRSVI